MANLPEDNANAYDWDNEGIYQLEVDDPVEGGADGIANLQAKKLALRTRNLHDRVELKADKESPVFSGIPKAPTAHGGTNTNQLATTAFVLAAIADLVSSSPSALDTLNELAAALNNDPNFATTITNLIAQKLNAANNLDDLPDPEVARDNLELGFLAVRNYLGYNNVDNSLKSYQNLSNGNVNLSLYGGGKITLGANTAFSFTGFQLNKSYLLIIDANGYTPSFANTSNHLFISGNADFDDQSIFYVSLTCVDATPGSEKLLTTIMKGA